jgi:carotenoid cleavage dioxygenase
MNATRRDVLRMASGLAATTVASSHLTFNALAASGHTGRDSLPAFMTGHFEPVMDETTAFALPVRGAIPPALSGSYVRNGHNPKDGINPGAWFYGSGMVHGIRLSGGRVAWYRNRWVRTPALDGAKLFREDGTMDLHASAAATSIVRHAGRILALQEVNLPFEITPELETVGAYDFDGALRTMMTAHPKICPATGEMIFIGNSPLPPHLTYHVADKAGRLVTSEVIEGPGPSVIHDVAITKSHVVWFDGSLVLNLQNGLAFPYGFDRGYRARIGVMKRDRSGGEPPVWIDVDPHVSIHLANSWEDASGRIIVEGPFMDEASWRSASDFINGSAPHGAMPVGGCYRSRWTIDPAQRTARNEIMDDLVTEFPTMNLAYTGRESRYSYACSFPWGRTETCGIARYDLSTGERQHLSFPMGVHAGEPCFAADPTGRGEDHGWLLTYVTDLRTRQAELWILDATRIAAGPVAAIEIPAWVPAGVHGSWLEERET